MGRTWGHVSLQPSGVGGGGSASADDCRFELNRAACFLSIRGVLNDVPHAADFQLAQRCLDWDEASLKSLMRQFREPTVSCLVVRGATGSEAEELVSELWAECIQRENGLPGRLTRYDGTCALQTWLNTVTFNRWYSRKRTQQRDSVVFAPGADGEPPAHAQAEAEFTEARPGIDFPLIAMMREALEEAFEQCSDEEFVILQLMHCDRLRLHEIAVMFECHEGSVSKRLGRAEKRIAVAVMKYIRQRDPWVVLQWSDFLDLCRTATPDCLRLD